MKIRKEGPVDNKAKLLILTLAASITLGLGADAAVKNSKKNVKVIQPVVQKQVENKATDAVYTPVNSLDVVANPTKYLHKKIKIKAKFDKFSTLGLDYKPAYRSSEKYITFLIKRDDVTTHTIPLSEMKNFLDRETAEKYIDLKPGDEIEYSGTVFSDALGDAWISVEKFTALSQQSKEKDTKK